MNPFEEPKLRIPTTAPLVYGIRAEVKEWRENGYEGTSATTHRLLDYWFNEAHGDNFRYYYAQREAIESLIYLYEVKKFRNLGKLIIEYDSSHKIAYNPHEDVFAKYCFKMATGAGKTKVMSLAIVWSVLNSILEKADDYPTSFLMLAPNIAVYDRLKTDFESGKIFYGDPLIPEEYKSYFSVEIVLNDQITPKTTYGRIYLTNIQKLYEREKSLNPVQKIIGTAPSDNRSSYEVIIKDLQTCDNIAIINDEAHHVWDNDIIWAKLINKLYESFKKDKKQLLFQLDFTATPKRQDTGSLFEWIISDFPLADAIRSGVVKSPIIGEVENPHETPSDRADVVYRDYIEAGCRRWKKYYNVMKKVGKKPIIFFMATKTKEAEEITTYLESQDDFKGKTLLIHTDLKGNMNDKEWEKLKLETRQIDNNDKYNAIVSVLMLREGWDVKNVNVIVGLRPFTSKAEILPEQALGRGLRLMFGPESGYQETVDVFGTRAFVDFIDSEMKKQGVEIKRYKERELPDITNIFVDPSKKKYNISIPMLSPKYKRENRSLEEIEISELPNGRFNLNLKEYSIEKRAIGRDALTEKTLWKDRWDQPIPETYEAVIAYTAGKILRACKIPSRDYEFIAILKRYIEEKLFIKKVNKEILGDNRFLLLLSEPKIINFLDSLFIRAINKLTIKPHEVSVEKHHKELTEINPSLTRKKTYEAQKCILNKIPVGNDLENQFCIFLDRAKDVKKFIKNDTNLNFYIEYVNVYKGISYYLPDFVVETDEGMFIAETKGEEDINVALKDKRAKEWCEDASSLTKDRWKYVKVPERIFKDNIDVKTFGQLVGIIESFEEAASI
jgi:type III restriction enzyme